jgi:hypothetical protein
MLEEVESGLRLIEHSAKTMPREKLVKLRASAAEVRERLLTPPAIEAMENHIAKLDEILAKREREELAHAS